MGTLNRSGMENRKGSTKGLTGASEVGLVRAPAAERIGKAIGRNMHRHGVMAVMAKSEAI